MHGRSICGIGSPGIECDNSMIIYQTKEEVRHPNFVVGDKIYVVKCEKCRIENYSMAVSAGICYKCGDEYVLKIEVE